MTAMQVASFHNPAVGTLDSQRAIRILQDVADELIAATLEHGSMASAHEGYAVILEELDELWDEVKTKLMDGKAVRREAIQVATMAVRFVHDVCDAADA